MFNAWLIYDREGAEKNQDYIAYHKKTGKKMGIFFELKMREDMDSEPFLSLPDLLLSGRFPLLSRNSLRRKKSRCLIIPSFLKSVMIRAGR